MKVTAKRQTTITLNLELSEDEATALATIMWNVAGNDRGPRGVADTMLSQLNGARIHGKDMVGQLTLPDTYEELDAL